MDARRMTRRPGGSLSLLLLLVAACSSSSGNSSPPPRVDLDAEALARANALLGQLTQADKIALVTGAAKPTNDGALSAGYISAVNHDAVAIPALHLGDSPNGVGNGNTGVTQFPPAITVAATWDVDLAKAYGDAVGSEWHGKGVGVGLGPALNITRTVYNGRTAEYFGEDPWLAGHIASNVVQGIQGQNVIATLKHFAANNQETDRSGGDSLVSERALREIYLPAFETAVREGGAQAMMCSYNRLNGTYACESPYLLDQVLRKDWGFKGFVMSDWGALHSTTPAALAGLDMDMPGTGLGPVFPSYYGSKLTEAIAAGSLQPSDLDEMVRRTLFARIRVGLIDHPVAAPVDNVSTDEHKALALRLSQEGSVLLQNRRGVLPLDPGQRVAIIGPAASAFALTGLSGSGIVTPSQPVVTPLEAITGRVGASKITYALGSYGWATLPPLSGDSGAPGYGQVVTTSDGTPGFDYAVTDASGNLLASGKSLSINSGFCSPVDVTCTIEQWPTPSLQQGVLRGWKATFQAALTSGAGTLEFSLTGSGVTQVLVDGAMVAQTNTTTTETVPFALALAAGTHSIEVTVDTTNYSWPLLYGFLTTAPTALLAWNPEGDSVARAVSVAANADVAVIFVSASESEGVDHAAYLPGDQDQLVSRVAAVAKKTVVVLNTGAPYILPWADQVDGILENWYGGQAMGTAVAQLLYGDVNPSGKLVATVAASEDQYYARQPSEYPGTPATYADGTHLQVHYDEGIFVGYRWFDQHNLTPRFPFGHGLSYTTFSYSGLSVQPAHKGGVATVKVTLTNTGKRDGAEVAQLYVQFPSWAGEPPRQLKGFQKVKLKAGASADVTFSLDARAFQYWDADTSSWVTPAGPFEILVGSSSRDIRASAPFTP